MSDRTRALALVLTGALESRGPPRQPLGVVWQKRAKIPLDKQHGIFDAILCSAPRRQLKRNTLDGSSSKPRYARIMLFTSRIRATAYLENSDVERNFAR